MEPTWVVALQVVVDGAVGVPEEAVVAVSQAEAALQVVVVLQEAGKDLQLSLLVCFIGISIFTPQFS